MSHHEIEAERLSIYTSEAAHHDGSALYEWLVEKAFHMKTRGATARKALCGFGRHHKLHHQHIISISGDLPIVVEIIDTPDRIDAFLASTKKALIGYTYIRERVRWHQPEEDV